MQRTTGKRSLEAYKIFPYIAWSLTIGFTLFVYGIVVELQDVTAQLQQQTSTLQKVVDNPNAQNVERYQTTSRPQ